MAIEEFSRDLGYLDKFFDKLEGHASTLSGEAGPKLLSLLGEERKRWDEIRSLLAGGSVTSEGREAKPVEPGKDPAPAPPQAPSGDTEDLAPVAAHYPHPYTRALHMGLSMLPRGEPPRQQPAASAPAPAAAGPRGQKTFTVGSLRSKR